MRRIGAPVQGGGPDVPPLHVLPPSGAPQRPGSHIARGDPSCFVLCCALRISSQHTLVVLISVVLCACGEIRSAESALFSATTVRVSARDRWTSAVMIHSRRLLLFRCSRRRLCPVFGSCSTSSAHSEIQHERGNGNCVYVCRQLMIRLPDGRAIGAPHAYVRQQCVRTACSACTTIAQCCKCCATHTQTKLQIGVVYYGGFDHTQIHTQISSSEYGEQNDLLTYNGCLYTNGTLHTSCKCCVFAVYLLVSPALTTCRRPHQSLPHGVTLVCDLLILGAAACMYTNKHHRGTQSFVPTGTSKVIGGQRIQLPAPKLCDAILHTLGDAKIALEYYSKFVCMCSAILVTNEVAV